MFPIHFPECNIMYGPPQGLDENQCRAIPAYIQTILGGSCDGVTQVVAAWKLSTEELEIVKETGIIYLSVLGGLPAHYLSVNFQQAISPA